MKKFIAGFVFGIILTVPLATSASSEIKAYLFPSRVLLHAENTIQEIDVSAEKVINYNNRLYVDLHTLVESLGGTVSLKAPSLKTGQLNQIDIYSAAGDILSHLTMQDPDGYVSIGELESFKSANGTSVLTSGIIKVNKDLSGKDVSIVAYDGNGQYVGSTAYISLLNEDIDKPQVGDIRPFKTFFACDSGVSLVFKVQVHDVLKPVHNEDIDVRYGSPVGVLFGPAAGFEVGQPQSVEGISPFTVEVYNTSNQNININPVKIEFEVYKLDSDNQPGEIVYSRTLPTISGPISKNSGFHIAVSWLQRGMDSRIISPGKYRICIKVPEPVIYYLEGSSDSKENTFYRLTMCSRSYDVEFF